MSGQAGQPAREPIDVVVERWASRTLGAVTALTLFTMMTLTFVDVSGRYLLRQPVYGGYEITEFLMGILIGGIRVVQAPDLTAPGNVMQRVLARPWFIGQVLAGPVGVGAAFLSDKAAEAYPGIEAKARLAEIGTLYTAVAGMLNLLTIIDAAHRAGGRT